MKVLVTGSAGYIGSHTCIKLLEEGHQVVGLDNYSRGNPGATIALERFPGFSFVQVDIRDQYKLVHVLKDHEIEAVMHFAAYAYVGESCLTPLVYYNINLAGSISLLSAMTEAGITRIVFSSTCATYGEPPAELIPISEICEQHPINPYGRSKLAFEQALKDFAESDESSHNFCFAILRYFNVAGADPCGRIGEVHNPETHLIPRCLQAALDHHQVITIFGTDYPTGDGTCIRDYVHVDDLVDAHVQVLKGLKPGDGKVYNIGTGRRYSVFEVIRACKKITGVDFKTNDGIRRKGDPPVLYADPISIKKEIGWKPKYVEIETMITDAWKWMLKNPHGFKKRINSA